MWIVRVVQDNTEEMRSNYYFGPFQTAEAAQVFINDYPTDDDTMDMDTFYLTPP